MPSLSRSISHHFFLRNRILVFISLIVFLFFLFYRILLIFKYTTDLGGIENSVIYFVQRSMAGLPIYTNPELPPYSIAQYPPYYLLLNSILGKLFGINPDMVFEVFVLGRVISLIFNLAYVFMVYRTSRKIFDIDPLKALVVSVMSFVFLEITVFARADSIYLFIFFLSLYYFLCWAKRNSVGQQNAGYFLMISSSLAAIGFFCKQSAIFLPMITVSWLLFFQRRFKDAVIYVLGFSISILVQLFIFLV